MLYCASRSRTLRAASKIIAPSASGNGFSTTTRNTTSRCPRSEEHTSELQSRLHLVCRLLLGRKNFCSGRGEFQPLAKGTRRPARTRQQRDRHSSPSFSYMNKVGRHTGSPLRQKTARRVIRTA